MWLWPFYQNRISFDNISIIDPLFTLPLIILLITALIKNKQKLAKYALIYAFCYLSLGYVQKIRVKNFLHDLAISNQQEINSIKLNPTIGNIILWRTVYSSNNKYYINAIRQPLFGKAKIYQGPIIEKLTLAKLTQNLASNSILYHDIIRFYNFSQGFIYYNSDKKDIIADLRYGTLPNNLSSLWGIKINITKPEQHAKYFFLRNFNSETKRNFKAMILGNDLN